jgi:hypothetical protein
LRLVDSPILAPSTYAQNFCKTSHGWSNFF